MSKRATDFTYFNLHTHEFSIRRRGLVRAHGDRLIILPGDGRDDVGFKVSEAGRQRVLREKRKNVHAFVVGDAYREAGDGLRGPGSRLIEDWRNVLKGLDEEFGSPVAVSYNPYKGGTFYRRHPWTPISGAEAVIALSGHGNYPPLLLAYAPR